MNEFYAYHVVTNRPMKLGQHIIFDERHHSGVFQRVADKSEIVNDIYARPSRYLGKPLEHHTNVAVRELALEEVRLKKFPSYPSRMSCLYVSFTLEEAEKWCRLFLDWGRTVYQIVRLRIKGGYFAGDANNCFDASPDKAKNLKYSEHYWNNKPNADNEAPIVEVLVDGDIEVIEIIREVF